ncbi:MAG TPA: FlgD immunoglobulin-like domain containing protein [Gaiellaceae bacterium]
MHRVAVTALVLALLGGTTAAFALTQSLKLKRSPVTRPVFDRWVSPGCDCKSERARLSLVLRDGDTVDAEIVNAGGDRVRTLAAGLRRPKGRVTFVWDGRDDAGKAVPDGRYRLRMHLDDQRRTIVLPTPVIVDTVPPRGRIVRVLRRTISPDGDRRGDRLWVRYRSNEEARAILLANGVPVVRTKNRRAGAFTLFWDGRIAGHPAKAGPYAISLQLVDEAGNVSEPTPPVRVRVEYLQLVVGTAAVRRGGVLRFRVDTQAKSYRWMLFRPGGQGRPGSLVVSGFGSGRTAVRLPERAGPGTYVLRARVGRHSDQASIVVRPR